MSSDFSPSPDQEAALRTCEAWMRAPFSKKRQVFRLFGPAGTGKSTLVRHLVSASGKVWLYAAYTGKAALVMQTKGCDGARTLHSLIYRPDSVQPTRPSDDSKREVRFKLWDESPLRVADGVVIDECSMVDAAMGGHLESFNKKILVLGDPYQLPPVRGSGHFTEREPDVMLTEIHRQARDSGVLDLATFIREGGNIRDRIGQDREDATIREVGRIPSKDVWERMISADQIICGTNHHRHWLNDRIRWIRGYEGKWPVDGDRAICLRNDQDGLINGSMWRVSSAEPSSDGETVLLRISPDDEVSFGSPMTVRSWSHHFLKREAILGENAQAFIRQHQEFDYGYAITAHKSQGSQWSDVVVRDESTSFREHARRWLYTAITRASRRVAVFI